MPDQHPSQQFVAFLVAPEAQRLRALEYWCACNRQPKSMAVRMNNGNDVLHIAVCPQCHQRYAQVSDPKGDLLLYRHPAFFTGEVPHSPGAIRRPKFQTPDGNGVWTLKAIDVPVYEGIGVVAHVWRLQRIIFVPSRPIDLVQGGSGFKLDVPAVFVGLPNPLD
jgi:hypothetical protein